MTSPQQTAERAASAMWADDCASQSLGMTLDEVGPGFARLSMTVRTDMTNGHGMCHGGFLFALADSAFAFACNSHGDATVAAGAAIDFVAPAHVGERLTATARERHRGRRTGVYDIEVTRGTGELVAFFRGRSHRLGKPRP
jgi:acyl-CoA thioesterase